MPSSLTLVIVFCITIFVKPISSYTIYSGLGDSYAAGDGAGSSKLLPNFDALCARFSHAYPALIANSTALSLPVNGFRNLACGGATTTSVLRSQVYRTRDSDLVTIQVGGNEVDFFVVLNECVQQWHPFSTCELELARARKLVQASGFYQRFSNLITSVKGQLSGDARVLMLGYARFFNDATAQCDTVSFSSTNSTNFLTRGLRRQLNAVLMLLNDVIRGTAEAYGADYVDIDEIFEGHRFCEEGVSEPQADASWFFSDLGRHEKSLHSISDEHEHGHGYGQHTLQQLPKPFERFINFTQTFHPTREAHEAIASHVIQHLLRYR